MADTLDKYELLDNIETEEITSDDQTTLYLVTEDFIAPAGSVSGTTGIPCDDNYTIEQGWFLYDLQTGIHIIEDVKEIGDWSMGDLLAAKEYLEEKEGYELMGSAYHALVQNDFNWYVCEMADGTFDLKHSTALSSILECGMDPTDAGIKELHRCWNGEELGECPFDDDAEIKN